MLGRYLITLKRNEHEDAMRNLISLEDLQRSDIDWILERSIQHSQDPSGSQLSTSVVGTIFGLTSTRTRTAFTSGALRLGGKVINYSPEDLQIRTGETLNDTIQVLSRMLDLLVIRLAVGTAELRRLSDISSASIVNAMSFDEHPSQALADGATIIHRNGRLEDTSLLYIGEGNSTAVALYQLLRHYSGVCLYMRTPPEYGMPRAALRESIRAKIVERHDMFDLPSKVDFIYTTRWRTTGTSKRHDDWRLRFDPFRVTSELMGQYPDAAFMHDLPAHRGEEVVADVIDGPQSIIWDQVSFKLFTAMAILEWCLGV
jgi:ornithine carbamoyltransferase